MIWKSDHSNKIVQEHRHSCILLAEYSDCFLFGPTDRFCGAVGEAHGLMINPIFFALQERFDRNAPAGRRNYYWNKHAMGFTHGSTKTVR